MKSTGVGQNRQYPSTYAPVGSNPGFSLHNKPNRQQRQIDNTQQQQQSGPNFGRNNSYRPNRGSNTQPGQHSHHNQAGRQQNQSAGYRGNSNQFTTASANYQPRQVQKSADLEDEYSRLHRQDEMVHFVEDPYNPLSATDQATAKDQLSADKPDLPVLTLKNSLSKISFCDRECFNVNDNPTKEAILKYIETKYKGLNIIDNQYVLMKPHMLKNITYHEHILTTFTNGNPYLLFLTRIDNVPCSIFIDRKVKDGYCYPKIHCVQYKFAPELFDTETIFTGELVRDVNRNFQYLISDLLVHNGEYIKHRNILSRFQTLHTILDQQYTPDPSTEICPIYCKRLFQYADIKFLLKEFLPVLSYTCKGIVFHTLNNQFSDYAWVMPREKQIDVPRKHEVDAEFYRRFPEFAQFRSADINQMPHLVNPGDPTNTESQTGNQQSSAKRKEFVSADVLSSNPQKVMLGSSSYYVQLTEPVILLAMKTDIPDIINLYTQDNLTDKLGYAFIPNLRVSQMLHQAFKLLPAGQMTVPVSVAYHRIFNRWVPYEIASPKAPIDTAATLEQKKISNNLIESSTTNTISENITAIGLVI
jgi:hypothetical protein